MRFCHIGRSLTLSALPRFFALGVALAFGLWGCSDAAPVPEGRAAPRPNIVLIVTDDQAFSSLPFMPAVARDLQAAGTTFPNFILSDPICCPSRVSMLLGQYLHNHHNEVAGSFGCAYRFFDAGDQHRSIGKLLQSAGYRTGYFGKFLNSYSGYVRWGGERAKKDPLLAGWDDYAVLTRRTRYHEFEVDDNGAHTTSAPGVYQTDWIRERAISFVRASAAAGEPFLLFVAPQAPHEPARAAARHRGSLAGQKAPRVASFNYRDKTQLSLAKTRPLRPRQVRVIDARFRAHVEMLLAVDELVQALVASLSELGVLDDTFVFFTSDNGLHFGEHRIPDGKGTPFEESIRFPLIVRGPGVLPGVTRDELVSSNDLHPTVLELIGETVAPAVDGRSILPLLGAPIGDPVEEEWRHALLIESTHEVRNSGIPQFAGVRGDRYKLVRYDTGHSELYDLENDPYELRSIRAEAPPALVQRLENQLRALLDCHGETCRTAEDGSF